MLKEFRVKGFKNFSKELVMDFTARDYDFNREAVKDGIVKDCMVYGPNGCGKSNLGLALFDIVPTMTNKNFYMHKYQLYLNLDTMEKAKFSYVFIFDGVEVKYEYTKADVNTVVKEKLKFGRKVVLQWDVDKPGETKINLEGVSISDKSPFHGDISLLRFIRVNGSKDKNACDVKIFLKMCDFVERMLFVRSVEVGNEYIGYTNGAENIHEAIIKNDKLEDFQKFLKKFGLKYDLKAGGNQNVILAQYKKAVVRFDEVISTGTKTLTLLYFWLMKIRMNKASLLFIDEYDAFYHSDVAIGIVKELMTDDDLQCIVTTHDTNCMNNDLLRPDCYYVLDKNVIKALPDLTAKELRFAHNLQKMYVAGAFSK